ncbi:MAG TPA: cytochrome ubiquinol oxidase subunit I [Candidatus Dormibacteraeota bacterium]
MNALTLARWQFGATTLYHFIFVPLTIGLAPMVAIMQTAYLRSRNEDYRRMAGFFGRLFLVNFVLGVATGIVQEFQFGMNWAGYSRFVGDVFGAPLAIEGLLAFFLESTFLGLWIFGEGRLPEKLRAATIWVVAAGSTLSAFWILAANSWMQNPVGFAISQGQHRAEMRDFLALLLNPVLLVTFPHTLFGSYLTAGLFVLAVSGYHLLRRNEVTLFARAAQIALVWSLVASLLVAFSGHTQAQVMTRVQPMKMAAAEALYHDEKGAEFSLFAIGTPDGKHLLVDVTVPHLLSVLATNTWNGEVQGINDIQARYQRQYGPGDYTPIVPITYWSFRLMAGAGFLLVAFVAAGLWLVYRRRFETAFWFHRVAIVAVFVPFLANWMGWIFTEMGRQPWVVFSLLKTAQGVSRTVGPGYVVISLAAFTLLYGVLATIEGYLMFNLVRLGPAGEPTTEQADESLSGLVISF